MARVQVFEGGNVAPAETTSARYQAADFGPGIGRGVQQLGQSMGEAADVVNGIAAIHDEAAAKEKTNGINQWFTQAGYTGPDAFFSQQGKAALDGQARITKGLDELIKQSRASLQNPRQQQMFDNAIIPQRNEWATQIAQHAAKETLSYNVDESNGRAVTFGELARHSYLQNPDEGEQQIATGLAETENALRLKGAGPEFIAAKKLEYASGIYKDIGAGLATDGPDGPTLARAFADKHKDSMLGDDYQHVLDRATVQQNSLDAEARRLEAEQRRVQREAVSDARDRVQSAMSRIDSGLPLSPDEYTSAVSDARLTKDPNLLKRVQEGQFKNNLTLEYRNATPVELQNRVNQLSADIAKAGDKAKPEWLIERDHLSTMLNNSRSSLNRDPLSWGAAHLGIELAPLNLNDNSSIAGRINAATQVARTTGQPAQPLTADEAASLAPQWTQGTIQQKVALVTNLAKFGPLAGEAATQIASHDNGLQNLVGLATLQNRGVAASRVNQILTGYEAIKTKPKLIDKDDSVRQFNDLTGNAFQFLPGVKDGVYTNAKALLAAQANEHGWNEWADKDDRAWFRSVNSALGAYTNAKGEQVGGLHGFNGGTTVLPEDMTGTDFETRISRANGPQFRKAQNGDPAPMGNGRVPTATDIKRMQWVPSGEGIYRLTDGHGFVHTKDGRFYEIDVEKLPSSFDADLAARGYSRH
jgi:hypothetical protein